MNNTIAIFIANYTIGNSPSIINLLDLLSEHYCINLFLSNVQLKNTNVLKRQNIEAIDCGKINDRPFTQKINKIYLSCYDSYICFDPHGFVLCKELFPDAKPIYYSLELYMKNDHFGLDYPKYIMDKERKEIKTIKGLIIQSKEKENLFRKNYHLSDEIPSLILPVTYKGLSVKERSLKIREKHQIDRHKRIALHLGGIAEWFSCIELAVTFSKLKNWILFFQGYSDQKYLLLLKGVLSKYNITNVIISKETYDDIEDVNRIIMSCDVGIAWYNDISIGFRTAGKSSGKIAAYLRFGLPIVAKKYPSTVEAIEKTGAGVCADDFIEIPNALSQIDRDYEGYSENARREYDTTHRFGMYRSKIMEFIEGPNNQNAQHHFNWDRLLENKNLEDFLVSKELWGENQGVENPGRVTWRKYLKRKISNQKVRLLEIGFGAGIDYRALEKEGILDADKVEYFGADVTQKFVEYARNNLPKMKPYLIDGYSLPFEDKYFDLVYIRHVLEHQTHYRQLLSEALRVSKDEVFIIFFIELSEDASDRISFDGTWYHNTYSRKLFYKFVQELGFGIQELAAFHKNRKTDQVLILTRKSANNQNSQNVHVPDISRKVNGSIPYQHNNTNNCKTAVRSHRNIKAHPEVNKWELSHLVTNNLVPIVGIHPFPEDACVAENSKQEEMLEMVRDNPSNGELHLALGLLLWNKGDYKRAWTEIETAENLGITEWRTSWYKALIVRDDSENWGWQNYELARELIAKVIAALPQFEAAKLYQLYLNGYYSQWGQDTLIEDFFSFNPPHHKMFVDVGAFDGITFSNTRRLYETGWKGVCIEPVYENFQKCDALYKDTPVKCIRRAISLKEGMVSVSVEGTASSIINTATKRTEQVMSSSLTTLLKEIKIENIDFLSIDAEGVDFEVLQSLDFTHYKPQLIVIEHNSDATEKKHITEFMRKNNYLLWHDNVQDAFFRDAQTLEPPNFWNIKTLEPKRLSSTPVEIQQMKTDILSMSVKEKPLSILHTVEFYHPHVGGAEIVVQELSERLVKRGHRVTVATTKLANRTFAELNGVQIEEFDVRGAIARGFTGSDIARYQQFLLKHPADIMMNYAAQQWTTDLAFDTLA